MATREYKKLEWPERIHITQESYGSHHADVYDADTGAKMTSILEISWVMNYQGTWVKLVQSKYEPAKAMMSCEPGVDPDIFEPEYQGVVCTEKMYPCYHLEMTCGVKPDV